MTNFEGVLPALAEALTKRGYTDLTPVQTAMLAPELATADALVSAQTGSGKTIAFGMAVAPTLLDGEERFARAKTPLALCIAPTRELALQVQRELEWLFEMTGAVVTTCVGGMDMRTERRALSQGAHIVVGTPGRLRDHIERGSFDTSTLKAIVLDEADEMLDMGFRDDLEYMLGASPKDRRTLMFSATVPKSIATLAKRYQRNAVRVETTSGKAQHVDIEYRALTTAPNDKENAIINVLRYFDAKNAIVFCATRATVNHLTARFHNRGFSVVALSGELSQNERTHALQAMRDGRARVCVATDVAARGIDLPNLELVIHADVPKNKESLLHRSGRTGRAGRKGVSALIIPHNWRKRTERLLQSAKIEAVWAKPPSSDDILVKDRTRILDDPQLSAPLNEADAAFAKELLERHSAEQIASAFVRLHREGQPAPEELIDSGPGPVEQPRKQRDDFKNGVWFSMSIGRKHSAEPRWLLPMLCRAGHITKHDIGAIRIHHSETHVELTAESADRFMEAVGPSRKVEKNVTITKLDGIPDMPKDSERASSGKQYANKKSYDPLKSGPKRKFADKGGDRDRPTDRNNDRDRSKGGEGKKPWVKKSYDDNSSERAPIKSKSSSYDKPKSSSYDKPKSSSYDKPKSSSYDKPKSSSNDKPKSSSYDKPKSSSYDKAKDKPAGKHKLKGKPKGKPTHDALMKAKPPRAKLQLGAGKKSDPSKGGSSPMRRKKI